MRPLAALSFLLLLGAAPVARPQRIVSLNLCADQYLLALADSGQIAALTRFARDPQMSAAAGPAARVPISRGAAEDVLALRPDLLIATPGRRRETMAQLNGRNIATLDLPSAESYADIVAQIRKIAAAVGHADRGEALIRRMDAQLAALPRAPGRGRVAAYYQRRGFLTGTGTLVDDLMRRVGLTNLATRLGRGKLQRVPLEQMALARPDVLVVESATERIEDQGTEMLHHPILARIPRLDLPQAWTVCGGPAYVSAASSLSRQLRSVGVPRPSG
jgi:iron complex transport system substrate-binding protein